MSTDPYIIETYCGGCHASRKHHLNASLTDDAATCYECCQCHSLVYAKRRTWACEEGA